jgi:phage repressor protein C with HTH and peptisase S24 domain
MNELLKVSGQSMTPTLQNGDFVVADFDIQEFEDAMSKNPQEAAKLGF